MTVYKGRRWIDGLEVTADNKLLDTRFDLAVLSKDGFEWSYEGPAPAQLALAVLAHHLGNDDKALEMHEAFMREIVANFNNDWEMTSADVDTALEELKAENPDT